MTNTASELIITELVVPNYQQVKHCVDPNTGLRAIISIHSTVLGPALGGTRFWNYPSDEAALTDVKRLSEGMTYKAAAAGMDLGGGKAVILGDPATIKTPELLRSYGRFVESLGGIYITAADVGTNSDDLDIIAESTPYVVGKNVAAGGFGDSGYSTALGVFVSLVAGVKHAKNNPLDGLTVGVEGAGKVGRHLIGLLLGEGANVVVSERHQPTLDKITALYPEITIVHDLFETNLDVYAPCAMGASLNHETARRLTASVVCGAANNQLLTPDVEDVLRARSITWVPDYVANAGGLIQVDAERRGKTLESATAHISRLDDSVTAILDRANADGVTNGEAARRVVEDRIRAGS